MRVYIRLAQILDECNKNDHGVISRIAEFSKIDRHQVSKILNNKAKSISLETLSGICSYLIEECKVPPSQLPGSLFAVEPDGLWSLLARRKQLQICFGVRDEESRYVSWADSYLHGVLQHELLGIGLTERPDVLEQIHAPAYPRDGSQQRAEKAWEEGREIYKAFHDWKGDRGLICLGSVKSSVLVEILIAAALHDAGTKPFQSQDTVEDSSERSCPFFFRFRSKDPQPPSCYGGLNLSAKDAGRGQKLKPGIYYEDQKGKWKCCPTSEKEDSALVFYVYRPPEGILEVCMGGFSGTATACLAGSLRNIADNLWPPTYDKEHLKIGAFIVKFDFIGSRSAHKGDHEPLTPIPTAKPKVIPIPAAAFERRLG